VASQKNTVRGGRKQAKNPVRGGDRLTRITWPCIVDTPRASKGRGRSWREIAGTSCGAEPGEGTKLKMGSGLELANSGYGSPRRVKP
jgi:hypothetical protein